MLGGFYRGRLMEDVVGEDAARSFETSCATSSGLQPGGNFPLLPLKNNRPFSTIKFIDCLGLRSPNALYESLTSVFFQIVTDYTSRDYFCSGSEISFCFCTKYLIYIDLATP